MARSFRYVSAGVCPKCGRLIVRNPECTMAVCTCSSAVKVPLKPALLFRTNSRLYRKLENVAKALNVSVQELIDKTFDKALDDKEFIVKTVKELRVNNER